jgi:hypothetical protein
MQGETVLLLVLIFIILAAVIVIGVLYFMYTSKYDESNIFYKNLLEVIRENPSLSSDVESKLLKSDFDITDLTSNERSLSNIFGSTIYSENQLDRLNKENKDYTISEINRLDSNIPKDPEKGFYKNTYELINTGDKSLSNLYGLDFNKNDEVYNKLSNLKQIYDVSNYSNIRPYSVMNSVIDTQQGSNMSFQTSLNILNPLSNLTPFYSITGNDLKITSNLSITNLQICNKNDPLKCFDLSVNDLGVLVGKPTTTIGEMTITDTPFVFGTTTTGTPNTSNLYIGTKPVNTLLYNSYASYNTF